MDKQQRTYLERVHIIAGEFHKARFKTVPPQFTQHVKCPARGGHTLYHVYTNIKQAYRAGPVGSHQLACSSSLHLHHKEDKAFSKNCCSRVTQGRRSETYVASYHE